MKRVFIISIAILLLLSCGDGNKSSQSAPEEGATEFEIVGKKEKEPVNAEDEPVSVSSILSGKAKPSAKDGDVGDVVSSGTDDPFGGDVDYLDGDTGYDY